MNKSLFHLVSNVMFDATWGKHYYDELYTPYADIGHAILIENLSKTPVFQALYAQDTDTEFADAFIANATQGVVSDANVAWAQQHARALLESGASRGEVVTWAVNALHNLSESAPGWGVLKTFYNNREQVSEFFSVQQGLSSQNLSELQRAVEGVTADTASIADTISALRLQYGLEQAKMPVEAEAERFEMATGQLNYADIATDVDLTDTAIAIPNGKILVPETVKDSIIETEADTGSYKTMGTQSNAELSVDAAQDARVKLVISEDNMVFNDEPEMLWRPLDFNYFDPDSGEPVGSSLTSTSKVLIQNAEEAYIDASQSPDSVIDFSPLYPDTPVFSVIYQAFFVDKLFVDTGNANSVVYANTYSSGIPDFLIEMNAAQESEIIVNLGDGINAIAFSASNPETDDSVYERTYGDTTVYGFSEDDYLYQTSSYITLDTFEELSQIVTVEDGNTIINLPGYGATITLVGYDSLSADQFWSETII